MCVILHLCTQGINQHYTYIILKFLFFSIVFCSCCFMFCIFSLCTRISYLNDLLKKLQRKMEKQCVSLVKDMIKFFLAHQYLTPDAEKAIATFVLYVALAE